MLKVLTFLAIAAYWIPTQARPRLDEATAAREAERRGTPDPRTLGPALDPGTPDRALDGSQHPTQLPSITRVLGPASGH